MIMGISEHEKKSDFSQATTQKLKFSIKDFFSKCDQIHRKLRIWSHLLKKSLTDNVIFCAVNNANAQILFTKQSENTFVKLKVYSHKRYFWLKSGSNLLTMIRESSAVFPQFLISKLQSLNSFETKKTFILQNFVQVFYEAQQCLNNNNRKTLNNYIYLESA